MCTYGERDRRAGERENERESKRARGRVLLLLLLSLVAYFLSLALLHRSPSHLFTFGSPTPPSLSCPLHLGETQERLGISLEHQLGTFTPRSMRLHPSFSCQSTGAVTRTRASRAATLSHAAPDEQAEQGRSSPKRFHSLAQEGARHFRIPMHITGYTEKE